jgi:polysaccharide export outer membrane protein
MRTRCCLQVVVLAALVGVLTSAPLAQQVDPSPAAPVDYVLGPKDVLDITIWGQGGLSDRFTVEVDGTFTFPMLGRVNAGGLTVRQFQDELTARLADGYFREPHVTVAVQTYQSQHVFVVGEVRSPGTYTLTKPTTLVEALTLAGSTTPTAAGVALLRRQTGGLPNVGPLTSVGEGTTEIRVDLTALQSGMLSTNPVLQSGDTIVVPRAAPVWVFGHVGRPGEYVVARDVTLRQLLTLAGGVSQRGSMGRVKVLRQVNGREEEVDLELDDRVRPGDTVVVPERYF